MDRPCPFLRMSPGQEPVPQGLVMLSDVQFRQRGRILRLRATPVADQCCLEKTSQTLYRNTLNPSTHIKRHCPVSFLGVVFHAVCLRAAALMRLSDDGIVPQTTSSSL